jgi:hypothetical protein
MPITLHIEKVLYYLCHAIGYDHDEFYEIKHIMTIQLLSDLAGINMASCFT